MKAIKFLSLLVAFLLSTGLYAQGRGHGHGRGRGHHKHDRVVVRSVYRPQVVTVYHPAWHPHYEYRRRWVYFPKHRLYWDNWRNHYVYYENNVWVSSPAPPAFVINIDLSREKRRELREADDDIDDIYNR